MADSAAQAAELMKKEDVGCVPIVASDTDHHIIGIVTDRDLTLRLVVDRKNPETTSLSNIMTRGPATCHESDDINDAMEAMSRQQVRRIPIVDEQGRLCGIIAQADIARYLDERQSGAVLEDISQPRHGMMSRAFYKTSDSIRRANHGSNWFVAAGIGAAVGAGLMAALRQRSLSSPRVSEDAPTTGW